MPIGQVADHLLKDCVVVSGWNRVRLGVNCTCVKELPAVKRPVARFHEEKSSGDRKRMWFTASAIHAITDDRWNVECVDFHGPHVVRRDFMHHD